MMTHDEIKNGLQQLGFTSGWVVTGDKITLWENSVPQPSVATLKVAAGQWAASVAATKAATVAAGVSARTKLRALGLSNAEIDSLKN